MGRFIAYLNADIMHVRVCPGQHLADNTIFIMNLLCLHVCSRPTPSPKLVVMMERRLSHVLATVKGMCVCEIFSQLSI